MPERDPLIQHFEEILADPSARPATKVAAAEELARLREREPVLQVDRAFGANVTQLRVAGEAV